MIRPKIQGVDGLCEALAEKSHAAHCQGQHSGKGAGAADADEDQSIDQEGNGPDGGHQCPEQPGGGGREKAAAEKRQRNGKDGADAGPHQRDGNGLQQEIGKSAAVQAEKQLPVRVQEAGEERLHHLHACAGKVGQRKRDRAEQHQRGRRARQQPALLPAQGPLLLHQTGEPCAEMLHEIDHGEEEQQDCPHLVVLPPGDLFIKQQADSACAHIAQDGAVPHIALQQIEGVGEIGRQDLR